MSEIMIYIDADACPVARIAEGICIDGGMTRLMIYHGEHGWEYKA